MIGLLLLQALGAIGPQALPPTGCAAFLWSRDATPRLVAMVGSDPGTLVVQVDGKPLTLSRIAIEGMGEGARGFAPTSRYAAGGVSATVALRVAERPDLADGALVPEATVTVEQAGRDTIVAPLGGMIGCASTAAPAPRSRGN